jgi:hypothetical protein
MKSKITIIAALLFVAPFLQAQSELRPVMIRLTRLASEGQKEVIAPAIVVSDTQVARIHVGSDDASALDVSVSPKLDGDQLTLTMRSFAKDKEGREITTSLPVIVTKLDSPTEIRVGVVGYRILATLDIPKPKKKA